jgi:hypothetical protein
MSTTLPVRQPRSLIGPLLLIAGGTLWLLNLAGVISPSNVWAVLRFWPVLLIALGIDALLRWRWPLIANVVDVIFVAVIVGAIIFAPRLGLPSTGSWFSALPFVFAGRPASGTVVTETRDVSGFDAVDFSSIGDLTIQPGEREGLTLEGQDDLLRLLKTEVRNGTLHIRFDERNGWVSVYPTRPLRLTLTVVELESIRLSGAGNVIVNDLTAGHLQANLSGAGTLNFANLEAEALNCNLSGAGSLDATGTANRLDLVVSGLGSFNGADLSTQATKVTLSGTGSATVWATSQLDATLSGLGSVTYYGDPIVHKTVSGLGNIVHRGGR